LTKEIPYQELIPNNEHLTMFIAALRKFNKHFTEAMAEGSDFTLKLEIRGNNRKLHHCRANIDEFERPTSEDKKQTRMGRD